MSTNPNPKRRSLWVKNRLVALEASVAAGGEDLTTALAFISDCHHVIQSHRPNPEALEAAGSGRRKRQHEAPAGNEEEREEAATARA